MGSGGEAHARVGMHDAGRREPHLCDPAEAIPGHPAALASAPKRFSPEPSHLVMKCRDFVDVAWHSVVVEVSPQHARQPAPLLGDRPVPASPKLLVEGFQFRPQPLFDGDPPEPEAPVPGLPTNMGEPQEVKRLRLSKLAIKPGLDCLGGLLDDRVAGSGWPASTFGPSGASFLGFRWVGGGAYHCAK